MKKVAVVYHQFPHYRAPVLRELSSSSNYSYQFWASKKDFQGVKAFQGDASVDINALDVKETGRGFKIAGYSNLISDASLDSLIILGNPNISATWVIALLGRIKGLKVLFWTHGWLKPEPFLKSLLRNFYYNIAHTVLVYGERAKVLGVKSGFSRDKITTIYNSLDFVKSTDIFSAIESGVIADTDPRSLFERPEYPLIICTARLTAICRFDLLLLAAERLKLQGININILLVGDGAERDSLKSLALDLKLNVHFFGACYDEVILGQLIYHSDLTVSPGKIGLTAIHSLTYGTPAITHGDFDLQMPEYEVIEPGVTGAFFRVNDVENLALALKDWFSADRNRSEVRKACRQVIERKWNPKNQKILIEMALDKLFGEGK